MKQIGLSKYVLPHLSVPIVMNQPFEAIFEINGKITLMNGDTKVTSEAKQSIDSMLYLVSITAMTNYPAIEIMRVIEALRLDMDGSKEAFLGGFKTPNLTEEEFMELYSDCSPKFISGSFYVSDGKKHSGMRVPKSARSNETFIVHWLWYLLLTFGYNTVESYVSFANVIAMNNGKPQPIFNCK